MLENWDLKMLVKSAWEEEAYLVVDEGAWIESKNWTSTNWGGLIESLLTCDGRLP